MRCVEGADGSRWGLLHYIGFDAQRTPLAKRLRPPPSENSENFLAKLTNLGQNHDLVNALMDNSTDHIRFKDLNNRLVRIYKVQAHLFGLRDPAEAIWKTDLEFYTAGHAQLSYADEREIIRAGRSMVGREERQTWPEGHLMWASATTARSPS
jgi:hypothetical protein